MNKLLLKCLLALLLLCPSFNAQNIVSEEMLFMDSDTVLLKTNKRAFYANKLVDAHVNYPYVENTAPESVGEGLYRVLNMLPAEFENLSVYAKLAGIDDTILVDKFSLIKAYTSTMVELPFVTEDKIFQTKQGKSISITNSKSKFESLWPECKDSLFQKVRSIKQTTYYQFTQQNLNNKNWGKLTPQIARHFTTSLANLMYLWSEPFFEELITNYSGVVYNNKARVVCLNVGDSLIKVKTWSSKTKIVELTSSVIDYDTALYGKFDTYEKVEKLKMKETKEPLLSVYPNALSIDKFYVKSDCINIKNQLLDRIFNFKKILFCPTSAVNGLGGNTTFGLRNVHFQNALYEKAQSAPLPFKGGNGNLSTWAHEWAHCVGYSHSSNATYGDVAGSWVDITSHAFDVMSTDNDTIPAVMYNDNQPRIITASLPFMYNIYIQEIEYTDSIELGIANQEMYTTASIQIQNKNYNAGADLIIDEIICPEWMSYDGEYPIVIASKATSTIPLTVLIRNTSDTILQYSDLIVVKGANTLNIPVTATVNPGIPTWLGDDNEDTEISVFPNPSNGVVAISSDYDYLEVYDLKGKKVYFQTSGNQFVDISSLPRGIYMMNIFKANKSYIKKVVIE